MKKLFSKNKPQTEKLKLIQKLSYGRSVVGIDIGASSVNVAQMANYRGKLTLVRTRIVDIDAKNNENHDDATLRALHVALEDFNRRNIKYACVVSCPQTAVRRVVTPYMPKEDLLGAVSLEAKRSIPFPLSDAVLDYNVIEEIVENGVEKLSIIVAASPKTTIERILSFFTPRKSKPFSGAITKKFDGQEKLEPLDIKISALLPLSLCLENVIERSALRIDETLVTIEIGTVVTELDIYENARLKFSRKIPFSGRDITGCLTEALMTEKGRVQLTLEEAEKIKKEYGIPKIEENKEIEGKLTTNQILSLIRPKVEQLTHEIERSFDFYREEMNGSKIDRVVLFGGGAQLRGLPGFLCKELELDVEIGNPLADIDLISDNVVEREADAQRLVLAIGAALSRMKGINLLPLETKVKVKRTIKKAMVNTVVVAIAALMLLTVILLQLKTSNLEKKLENARLKLNGLSPQLKVVKEYMVIGQLLSSQPYWEEILKEISNVIPENMYLENITMKEGLFNIEGVVGKGKVPSETALSQFMVDLEKGLFKNVRLVNTKKNRKDIEGIEFEISCGVE